MSKVFVTPMGSTEENFLAYMLPESKVVELTGIEPWNDCANKVKISGAEVREKLSFIPKETDSFGLAVIATMASWVETVSGKSERVMYIRWHQIRFKQPDGSINNVSDAFNVSKFYYIGINPEGINTVNGMESVSTSNPGSKYDKTADEVILFVNSSSSTLLERVTGWRAKAFLICQTSEISA